MKRIFHLVVVSLGASAFTFSLPASGGGAAHGGGHGPAAEEEISIEDAFMKEGIVIVEPKRELDPELASEQVMKYLEAAITEWKGGDVEFAEEYFSAALGVPTDVPEKEVVLSRMGQLYNEAGMFPKAAAVYERLATEFPDSRRLPEVYMEVGNLYRKMGAPELAISKYYMVLNSALNVSFDQLEKYRQLSLEAKMAIAETHKEREENQEAYRLYQSLFRLELKPVQRLRVHYRMCYLLYELGNYQQAVSQLKLFLDEYPDSPHNPELRYLLASSYEKLNRKPDALREVVTILQSQVNPDSTYNADANYWKQRTGNELANEFYEKGDFRSALTIYQALARYNSSPAWRWPAIHQIGLCFERLGLPDKAKLAYEEILNPEAGAIAEVELTENLRSLRQMAQWRLEHLNWEDDLLARLQVLKTE
ncbi:tetratricopeptide repeat protein [Pelagicoccus sp. SDUM812003]|uniref:tetratricopeptide repeat protein n=1 Tax=Pelagicoccus sp. SDUM812003 TaxID=3041267 RepID=UPI00280FBB99|nr:tetratricopeptide repeat protein [Pelagicoccus sp. SDUM812003]MDQ8201581.1 tetratricopeptide repeat protein [Pelagicoccus sp. SDUM812003]